jgi:hypothetical protein
LPRRRSRRPRLPEAVSSRFAHAGNAWTTKAPCTALARDEVVGTPLAIQVFELIEAVFEQDDRLF